MSCGSTPFLRSDWVEWEESRVDRRIERRRVRAVTVLLSIELLNVSSFVLCLLWALMVAISLSSWSSRGCESGMIEGLDACVFVIMPADSVQYCYKIYRS